MSGELWVVFSKSNLLVAQRVDKDYHPTGDHIEIAGHHKMSISGMYAVKLSERFNL